MRAGFGTYVPPNRRGTTKEPEPSIPTVTEQPRPKFLVTAKNRQESTGIVTVIQSEAGVEISTAEKKPTTILNEPETTSKVPTTHPFTAVTTSSSSLASSSTNETIKNVAVAEEKVEVEQKRKPKVSRGTTGVYVPPSRRAAAAAAVSELDTEIPETTIMKKRKHSIDDMARSTVHPTLGDVTVGLTSSSSKSSSISNTTTLPITKRGRGFQKLLMEQANAEEISERKRIAMLQLMQQSTTDQCMVGTTSTVNTQTRPETVFLDEVSASQRMIFHSLGIVVKKTTSS